jgi:ribosomal protein S18 acetylase RimI-like enzyme
MSHRTELAISVVKEQWGSGIGSMIMEQLMAYARNNSVEIINLEVRSDNSRAIHLYEKYGFKRIGTLPAFFKIGAQYVDFECMYLDLR